MQDEQQVVLEAKAFTALIKSGDLKAVREQVKSKGFSPLRISDPPGRVYASHNHRETKLLAFLEGTMQVSAGEQMYECGSGDLLIIPGGMRHSALVGDVGCTFLWAEKII